MVKPILLGLLVIVLLGGAYLYFAFLKPVTKFTPTGDYQVGATNFDFSFESAIKMSQRKLSIAAWYPTNATRGELNPVASKRTQIASLKIFGLPEFLAEEEASLSFKNAPMAEGTFPVVVFNHGFASFAEQNTVNMQELASNGYVVLAISHPGTSLVTEYADATSVSYDASHPVYVDYANAKTFSAQTAAALKTALVEIEKSENFASYWAAMRGLAQSAAFVNAQPLLKQWIEDTDAIINAIANTQTEQFPKFLNTQMDAKSIGLMGHSMGGITANAVSLTNTNIKAVVNLDGPFAYDIPEAQAMLSIPTCFLMASETAVGADLVHMENINLPLLEQSGQQGCYASFVGARHLNFSDLNYVSFLKLLPILGAVDQADFGAELNHSILHFFNWHLKGQEVPFIPITQGIVEYQEF